MFEIKNTDILRRDLKVRVADNLLHDKGLQELNRIPVQMTPKGSESSIRCCIYKERAMTRSAILAIFNVDENEDDETKSISEFAEEKLNSEEISPDILTVLTEGCSACTKSSYVVTNACRGCVARPCLMNCPAKAISFEHGRSVIDPDKCRNCGKCLTVCPYHAITYIPVPCQDICPVGAISKDEQGKAQIDHEKCILCGKCMTACPFGAIFEKSQMPLLIQKIKEGKEVIAMPAPAIAGQFTVDIKKIFAGMKKLGFSDVAEVAYGAIVTGEHESKELMEKIEEGDPYLTSSCCPAYVNFMKKHNPQYMSVVSSTLSPMKYTSEEVKRQRPDAITVFIGPCIAKKSEALSDPNTDLVISFEELGAMFAAEDIQLNSLEPYTPFLTGGHDARNFAVTEGVATAIKHAIPENIDFKPQIINGLNKKSSFVIKSFCDKKLPFNFLEVMSCEGGCIAGPNSITNPKIGVAFLKKSLDVK